MLKKNIQMSKTCIDDSMLNEVVIDVKEVVINIKEIVE